MEEWYLRSPDGCRLYVAELGAGSETLVVLHGGFGSEHSYLLDAFEGVELPFRVVFYDQRGSLRSPAPLDSISVAQHLADLDLLQRELGVESSWLFGHSMGSLLAMMYSARHAERVSGLVLVSPMLPTVPLPEELASEQLAHDQMMRERRARRTAEELNSAGLDREGLCDRDEMRRWRIESAGTSLYHVERWRQLKSGGVFVNVDAGETAGASLPQSWDLRSSLARVEGPITVILGDHDWTAPTTARALFGPLANCELVVVPRAGHNVWIDQPELFRSEVVRVLTGRQS